jgi:hypothetical protein
MMKYADGRLVAVGDRVKLSSTQPGTVVCSIDTGDFTKQYPEEEWGYLKTGIIVVTDAGETFHYSEPDEDFERLKPGTRM